MIAQSLIRKKGSIDTMKNIIIYLPIALILLSSLALAYSYEWQSRTEVFDYSGFQRTVYRYAISDSFTMNGYLHIVTWGMASGSTTFVGRGVYTWDGSAWVYNETLDEGLPYGSGCCEEYGSPAVFN